MSDQSSIISLFFFENQSFENKESMNVFHRNHPFENYFSLQQVRFFSDAAIDLNSM